MSKKRCAAKVLGLLLIAFVSFGHVVKTGTAAIVNKNMIFCFSYGMIWFYVESDRVFGGQSKLHFYNRSTFSRANAVDSYRNEGGKLSVLIRGSIVCAVGRKPTWYIYIAKKKFVFSNIIIKRCFSLNSRWTGVYGSNGDILCAGDIPTLELLWGAVHMSLAQGKLTATSPAETTQNTASNMLKTGW